MTFAVVFRPQAEDEVISARQWYERQRPGLGARFAAAFDDTIARVGSRPSEFPVVHGQIRRAVMRQFPYGVYFREHGQTVVVLAVMHGRRHPSLWQSRA
jgi:plasmid stabilization system protein ParE